MSDSFDPYHRWLGIAPKHQPADYYRLLGIDRFEADPEVIADAAERQIAHVRRYQLGPHSDLSQRILNELARAKGCLLNPAEKAEYDRKLHQREAAREQAVPQPAPPSASPLRPVIVPSQPRSGAAAGGGNASAPKLVLPDRSRRPRPGKRAWLPEKLRPRVPRVAILGAAVVGGIMLGLVVVFVWSLWPGSGARAKTPVPPADVTPEAAKPVAARAKTPVPPADVTPEAAKPVAPTTPVPPAEPKPEAKPDEMAKPDVWSQFAPKPEEAAKGKSESKETDEKKEAAKPGGKKAPPPLATSPFDAAVAKEHQRRWAEYLGVEVEFTNSIGMRLTLVPAGEFLMGSPDGDSDAQGDEKPPHKVQISKPFYLGETEVTQEQYERVTGVNPSGFKGDPQRPVETVSWEDAVAFCRKLSAQEGQTYRLSTEAEWEYACRAGSSTKWSFGDDESALKESAWCEANSDRTTHPVGQKKPNGWGLYDMHGNVWEWCSDWYDENYYQQYGGELAVDPTGASEGSYRVYRGGCGDSGPWICRSAYRDWFSPSNRDDFLGFRVARSPSGG